MKIDLLIEELNSAFELDTVALDSLIKQRGEGVKHINWSNVRNVYEVSNHYNQVCAYKQLNLMIKREAKVGAAVKGYAVNAILEYINSARGQQCLQFHNDVRSATKSSIKRPIRKTQGVDYKVRAEKAEDALKKACREIRILKAQVADQKEEIATLKAVGKQLVINNIKLARVSGIEVSVEELGV